MIDRHAPVRDDGAMIEQRTVRFKIGDWIRWTMLFSVKEGRVVGAEGCSLVVKWLGGEEQVFPNYWGYVPPESSLSGRMERVERPRGATRIERETRRGVMSVARASAILGVDQKRVRAKLRSGSLEGVKKDGKWIGVNLPED